MDEARADGVSNKNRSGNRVEREAGFGPNLFAEGDHFPQGGCVQPVVSSGRSLAGRSADP